LLTPYPPDIPLPIPGERFDAATGRHLGFARHFNGQFPGLETDIHGLVRKTENGKARYYVDCVR
jgi:arginine decarboxylase